MAAAPFQAAFRLTRNYRRADTTRDSHSGHSDRQPVDCGLDDRGQLRDRRPRGGSTIPVLDSRPVGNNIAVQSDASATLRLSNNVIMNNLTGLACGIGGAVATAGNNRKAGNVCGVVPVCAPNLAITVQ
jgi:hypothetical protein